MPKGIQGFTKGNKLGGRNTSLATITVQKSREYLMKSIAEDLSPILLAQREAAKGIYFEKKIGKKKVIVYRMAPELKAGEYLLNQLVGKPKETIEMEGGPMVNIDKAIIMQINKLYDANEGNGKYVGNGKSL
mgnify:CR=1 FL=1